MYTLWGEGRCSVPEPACPRLQRPLLLYQGVGLGVGVAALLQVSSRVQQGLLGGAELGGLGQVAGLPVWERSR